MKAALLLLLSLPALAAEKSFDRTLTTSPNPAVSIETNSGNVHLHPGSGNQIQIYAKMQSGHGGWFGGSDRDVESRMQQIANNPPIRQDGNTVTIGERNHDDLYRNISIDYDITLPRAATLDAGSGSGDITVEDVGASLKAHTGSGNIHARGVGGPANLDTGSGDIQFEQAASGDVRAGTGSGNIHLDGLSGGLDTHTGSGDITVSGTPANDWRLQTGSGSLHLNLGPKAHFNLDANTGSGSVHTEQPISMQGTLDKHHVRGAVNGGGPTLRAGTGSGDIDIR